ALAGRRNLVGDAADGADGAAAVDGTGARDVAALGEVARAELVDARQRQNQSRRRSADARHVVLDVDVARRLRRHTDAKERRALVVRVLPQLHRDGLLLAVADDVHG